jgi:predicted RNA-binding protein with RPS1 domain
VKGVVVSLDEVQANVSVSSGNEEVLAQLSFRNFTKSKAAVDNSSKQHLAVGETIWACVLSEGLVPQLSTAALEARPGSMLTNKSRLFSALDQWASESTPDENGNRASFKEWRGEKELHAFLENGRKVSKGRDDRSRNKVLSKQLLPPEASSLIEWNPEQALSEGDIVLGTVASIQPFGVFVKVPGLSKDALIPISQVSKVRTDYDELLNGSPPPMSRGDEIVALVHAIEEDRLQQNLKSRVLYRQEEEEEDGSTVDEKESSKSGSSRFILSTRVLEGEQEGLVRRGLKEYNTHALSVHRKYSLGLAQRNLRTSKEALELFTESVEIWRTSGFEVPVGSIVQGTVTGIHSFGAFVKLDHGPSALLHKGAITEAKVLPKEGVLSAFKAGDTVYGQVFNRPLNTPVDVAKKGQDTNSAFSSPSSFWLSLKKFEKKDSVGRLFKDPEGYWKSAKAEFMTQPAIGKSLVPSNVATMTMHAEDLDVRNLRSAIRALQWVQFEALLDHHDRWPPSLSLSSLSWSDEVGQVSGKSNSSISRQYMKLHPDLAAEVAQEYSEAIAAVQDLVKDLIAPSLLPLVWKQDASSSLVTKGSEAKESQPWITETLRPEVRHAWMSSQQSIRKAIERISLLRLKSSLLKLLRGQATSQEDGITDVRQEVEQSAANVVVIAELLLLSSNNAETSRALLSELFPLLRLFPSAGNDNSSSLPSSVAERLMALGWNLISSQGNLGGSRGLTSSLVTEILALSSYHPPQEWSDAAFKLLYKSMLVNASDPEETVRFFRLMKALGYRPSSYSWWDRTLQQIYYVQRQEHTKPHVIEEMRSAISALVHVGSRVTASPRVDSERLD